MVVEVCYEMKEEMLNDHLMYCLGGMSDIFGQFFGGESGFGGHPFGGFGGLFGHHMSGGGGRPRRRKGDDVAHPLK